MGFSIKFNWVLQVSVPDRLDIAGVYPFDKPGNRVYPLNTPIDLINSDRQAIARIKIRSFTNTTDKTVGEYEVVKIYQGQEKEVLSQYWLENQ